MLERLSHNPYQLFEKPYMGYLLFLFGDIDAQFCNWFQTNVASLDTMTGPDVAFPVFSRRFRVRISTSSQNMNREPKLLAEVDSGLVTNDYAVMDLVKSGRFGHVNSGDELAAINDAVYRIASALGVTQHMPCVVAFDGLPHPKTPWLCVSVETQKLPELYQLLRTSVGRLQVAAKDTEYEAYLQSIADIAKSIPSIELRKKDAVAAIALLPDLLRKQLSALVYRHPELIVNTEGRPTKWAALLRSAALIRGVSKFTRVQRWPLQAPERAALADKLEQCATAFPQLLTLPCKCDTVDEVRALHSSLATHFVEQVCVYLPRAQQAGGAGSDLAAKFLRYHDSIMTRYRSAEQDLKRAEHRLLDTTRKVFDMPSRPSFTRLLLDQCKRHDFAVVPEQIANGNEPLSAEGSMWMDWLPVRILVNWLRRRRLWDVGGADELAKSKSACWHRSPRAFASYATPDRPEVLRRIQGMRAWQPGLDVFLDFHSLYPGEMWRERLQEEINSRDRFLLFWSRSASQSPYVKAEWQAALEMRGLAFITPVPLESPSQSPPPPELSELHFGDFFLDSIRFADASKQ